jgi:hypothetical protein
VVLRDSDEIADFMALLERRLITGAIYTAPSGERCATAHDLTADGHALLALRKYTRERAAAR